MRELLWTVAHTSGAKIYSLALAMITLSLTARWLGPEGRGQMVAITTWVTMFSTIGHLSLGQVAIHRATTHKDDRWLGEVIGSLLALTALFTVLCWSVAIAAYAITEGRFFGVLPKWLLFISFAALPLYIWEQYGSNLLILSNQIGIYNKYQVIGRTVGLLLLIVFVSWLSFGVPGAIYSAIIGQFVVAISGIRFLYSQTGGRIRAVKTEVAALLNGGIKLHWNAIGVVAFGSADILIINHFRGAQEAGYYQLASQLIAVMLIIPQAASVIMYGKIASTGPDAAWVLHKKILIYTVAFIITGSICTCILAPWIVILVAGAKFMSSVAVFRWLLLAVTGMTFSIIMAPQWVCRGFFLQAALLTIVVGSSSTLANFILVPRYGMLGATWSAIGAYSLSVLLNIGMAVFCDKKSRKVLANG